MAGEDIAAASPIDSTIGACWQGHSHVEMSACVQAHSARARSEREAAERATSASIQKRGDPQEYLSRMRETLKASAATYNKYRHDQCDFEAAFAAGGNAAHDLRTACEAEMDLDRAAQLRAWVKRGEQ